MFGAIINFLSSWFVWGKDTWQGAWTRVWSKATGFWAVVCTLATLTIGLINNSKDAYAFVVGKVADIVAPTVHAPPGTITAWLNVGNTIFPLAEALGYIVAWFTLYIACKVVGFSWKLIGGIFS